MTVAMKYPSSYRMCRNNDRSGSLADTAARIGDVRFTLRADMLSIGINVCKVPKADMGPDGGLR